MTSSTTDIDPNAAEEPLDSLRSFGRSWDRFWFTPSDPTTLGLMRLLSGLVILYSCWCYSFDLMSYFSPKEAWLDDKMVEYIRNKMPMVTFPGDWAGHASYRYTPASMAELSRAGVPQSVLAKLDIIIDREFSRVEFVQELEAQLGKEESERLQDRVLAVSISSTVPQQEVFKEGQHSWSVFYHLADPRWIWTVHILILFSMFLFTIGFATRITSVIAFLGAVSYIWRAQTSLFGMDAIVTVLLLYLAIGPSGAALSVDRWLEVRRERKRLRNPNAVVPLLPLASATFATRLMQIHFCFIYMAAGTSKLLGAAWWNGNALWACYANYSFAPLRVPLYQGFLVFLCRHRWLWEIFMSGGAMFTLFMELSLPYLVWSKRWRWIMVTGAVMLHTGIGLFMGLVTFSLLMLCLLLSFVPPEATRLFLARVAENARKLRELVFRARAGSTKPVPVPAR